MITVETYLGKLCKRGHDHDGTGRTLRYRHNGVCPACKEVNRLERHSIPEVADRTRQVWNNANKRYRDTDRGLQTARSATAAWCRQARRSDPYYRLVQRIRSRIRMALKRGTFTSRDGLFNYYLIANQVGQPPGAGYHLDHIKPLAAFNLSDPEQVRAAFAPENHQWLLATDNLHKSDNGRR